MTFFTRSWNDTNKFRVERERKERNGILIYAGSQDQLLHKF